MAGRPSKALRNSTWNNHIGETVGSFTCVGGATITPLNFEAGHIVSKATGGQTTIDNLRPICSGCNKSMGTENMNTFFAKMGTTLNGFYEPLSGDAVIEIYKDDEESETVMTEYRKLQTEAKDAGIKANLDSETLKRLLKDHKRGKEIDSAFLTKAEATERLLSMKNVGVGGGSILGGIVLGVIFGHFLWVPVC